MAKKRKRKLLIGRVYDLCIVAFYSIISLLFLMAVAKYTTKFLFLIALALLLILAIYITSLFYNKKIIEYTRRILLTLICVFILFAHSKINTMNDFFVNLSESAKDEVILTQMDVLSLADSDVYTAVVRELDDIKGKTVGINTFTDKKAVEYVQDRLDGLYKNIEYVEYDDYGNMISDLFYGYVDVIIFNTNQQNMIESSWGPLQNFTLKLKSYTYEEKMVIDKNQKKITKEPFTVLISANDEVGAPANCSKSDANMLVMVDPNAHQLILTSIPRDAYIGNPAYDYASDKLTHTGNNGVENTRKAVEEALGINIDFYVKVSFSSVIEIIDALGEIEVDVAINFCEQDENRSFENEDLICLYAGTQKLNGKQALAYARHRYSYENQDLGRNDAQMRIIKAVIKKILTPEGVAKIDDVLEIIPSYVLTNFSSAQMQSFIKSQVDDLQPWNVISLSLAQGMAADYVETASMPGVGTWVYYLNKKEVYTLQTVYNTLQDKKKMKDFDFNLNTLYDDKHPFKEGKNTIYYDPTLYE